MERTNQFDLQNSVNHFIEKINVNELLSAQEVAELKDHFLSQTEELQSVGLSSQEAFAVSKMRFGEPKMIQEEYEKSKPFEKWKRYLMVGFLSYFLLLSCNYFVTIMLMGLALIFNNNIILELYWIKYIYVFIYLGSFYFFFRWVFLLAKNGKIWSFKKVVPWIPILYVILFSGQMFILPYILRVLNNSQFSEIMTFTRLSFIIVTLGMIIITLWGIKKQWLYKTVKL